MFYQKQVKSVLNKHKKRDSWFLDDYSVNPYEGCSCNCLYCYIRGSKYGENMEEGLAVKSNLLEILNRQLENRAKRNQFGFVAIGSATDSYLHHENKYRLTRGILELMLKYRFPVFISTKCAGITRDLDLLAEIDRTAILPPDLVKLKRGVILSTSLSTLDNSISEMLERGASLPGDRLGLITRLKKEGFLAGVNAMPLLPYISDTEEELERLISSVKSSGADYILTASLTLFGQGKADSKTLFYQFLRRYNESLLPKYDQLFGSNFCTPISYQRKLKENSNRLCAQYQIKNSIL